MASSIKIPHCPNCGIEVSPNAKGCRRCGGELKPWSQSETYDGISLPGEDFDYEEFLEREFEKPSVKPEGISWLWWATGVLVTIAFGWLVLQGF